MELFENDDVKLVMGFPRPTEFFLNTNSKLPVIVALSGVVWRIFISH